MASVYPGALYHFEGTTQEADAEGQSQREIFFINENSSVVLRYKDENDIYHYYYEGQGGSGVIPSGIQEHIDDTTIHFIESDIDHLNIQNRGVYTHAEIDDFIASGGSGSGVIPSGITEHIDDETIHFTEAEIDHNNILNNGTNTHADIDAFIASGGGSLVGYGPTASRPATPYDGEPYFDTDLGYQINYNGTNWVNSTGATV